MKKITKKTVDKIFYISAIIGTLVYIPLMLILAYLLPTKLFYLMMFLTIIFCAWLMSIIYTYKLNKALGVE